jgi:FkbM family methyltransferase
MEIAVQNRSGSLISRLLTGILQVVSVLLCKIRRVRFPERKLGSPWFISRYRIEFCMELLEPESLLHVRNIIRPGMKVIDIGAHLGYYTRLLSRLAGPAGKVYAFEASPENFEILMTNLKSWHTKNVTAYNNAASDENRTVDLHVSPGHSNHSLVAGYTPSEQTVPVQAVCLDDLLANEKMDFVKIDVEGHELRVLNGMRKLIAASPKFMMLVEYNPIALAKACPSPTMMLDLLTELGFQYHAILEDGSLGAVPEGTKTYNLLCTKQLGL